MVFVHLARPRRTLPPTVTKFKGVVVREVLRHLALECLVLAALLANPRTIAPKDSRRSFDDLGVAEQEQPVGRSCHGGVFVRTTAADVVRELPDRVHLGLEIGRHEVPDLAGVHLRAELGPLPAADVGFRGIHAGFDSKRGGEERQAGLTRTVCEVVVVDADDAVGQRVPVRERYRPLGTRIHGVLRLGIELARVALFPDVLGHGLLVFERPVSGVLFLQLIDSAIGPAVSTAGISAFGPAGAVCLGEPARDAIAGLRDLPGDLVAEGKKPCADHDRNEDDDDILDGLGAGFRVQPA